VMETGEPDFVRVTSSPVVTDGGWSYGSSFADYDHDGDLDLFVAKWLGSQDEHNALFRNEGNDHHYLAVDCRGTISNRTALGAKVTVTAIIGGQSVRQTRVLSGQDSYCGQNLRLHFGLGDAQQLEAIEVRWPSGIVQSLGPQSADQILTITETQLDPGNRWLGHITREGGGFQTTIRAWNKGAEEATARLHGFDEQGNLLESITLSIPSSAVVGGPVGEGGRFTAEGVAYINVDAPDSCHVTASYESSLTQGSNAESHAKPANASSYWLYAGDWSLVFDGVAMTNTGSTSIDLIIRQYDASGGKIGEADLGALAPGAKKLSVLGDVLDSAPGSLIQIVATAPFAAVLLRGTYPGQAPALLFAVDPVLTE